MQGLHLIAGVEGMSIFIIISHSYGRRQVSSRPFLLPPPSQDQKLSFPVVVTVNAGESHFSKI